VSKGDVTRILEAIGSGDPAAEERLLPAVYAELRMLARARLRAERATHAPQPTSLVHEAYLRLVGDDDSAWRNRAHFFAAAGEAMRRVLVDQARERGALKRGGDRQRVTLHEASASDSPLSEDLLAVDQALGRLETRDRSMAAVVKLRYFAGLTVPETAEAMDLPPRTVNRLWTAARAWLQREMARGASG
jgi:RNA polymerase sigma factor (TIGR02999 family)